MITLGMMDKEQRYMNFISIACNMIADVMQRRFDAANKRHGQISKGSIYRLCEKHGIKHGEYVEYWSTRKNAE